jgi:hypothetical protein
MSVVVNTPARSLARAKTLSHGSAIWGGLCLKFVRTSLNIPAHFPSAKAAWEGTSIHSRHMRGVAPKGVPVFFKIGQFWHVVLSAGNGYCWSTDIKRSGLPDLVPISLITKRWGAQYLGWTDTLNGYVIPWKVKGGAHADSVTLTATNVVVNQAIWAQTFLTKAGLRATPDNIKAITTWEQYEGGHWKNSAKYNPLNTTWREPGSKSINSVGVQSYTSWDLGYAASVSTLLENGPLHTYEAIIGALRLGDNQRAVLSAIRNSPWGTANLPVSSAPGYNTVPWPPVQHPKRAGINWVSVPANSLLRLNKNPSVTILQNRLRQILTLAGKNPNTLNPSGATGFYGSETQAMVSAVNSLLWQWAGNDTTLSNTQPGAPQQFFLDHLQILLVG